MKKKAVIQTHKVQFKLYAPTATAVSLVGDFNKWSPVKKPLKKMRRENG